ncbi:conserved oligomeric Golgi complex subunit 6-like [Watersipora subatra]|uniref:conserved oligomeric Golgi complex subunit 6-like n=1 Tax=Watersipora subatra TaxID=2589382 RepID=UPI00355B132D
MADSVIDPPSSGNASEITSSNPLSRKLKKVLDTRLDNDKDTLEALKALSTFFTENNLRTRRNLRSDIEKRSLVINEEFLASFKSVKDQLDSIYDDVKAMNDCCQDMTDRLKSSQSQTRHLINQTTQLQGESSKLQLRMKVADGFLTKFQLSDAEVKALKGHRDGSMSKDFFKALRRVKEIHQDCKILLRTNHQTAGLEIMESMALYQETAYERLYRWAQAECRLVTNDSPDLNLMLCEGMAALQDRSVLFKYTLDEFCVARRAAIVRSFIDALTRGGRGGHPRPIELSSHDPLRYVGDILAWLHQACASEQEHISSLLRLCQKDGLEETVKSALTPIMEGLCRAFKVRVEQVLVSELTAVTLYKLENLVQFYTNTVRQMLADDAAMISTLQDIKSLSTTLFYNSLTCHTSKLLEQVELPTEDLSPPTSLTSSLTLLQEILSCKDSAVLSADERQQDYHRILRTVVEPLIQMCTVSASKLNTIEMAVYMVNCLHMQQVVLSLYEYTEGHLELIQAQMDAHVDTLISEDASFILNKLGLATIYNTMQKTSSNVAQLPGMDAQTVKSAMVKFDEFMVSQDSYHFPQMSLLKAPKHRELVAQQACLLIFTVYSVIYKCVQSPEQGYLGNGSILPHSPEQVKTLLNIP